MISLAQAKLVRQSLWLNATALEGTSLEPAEPELRVTCETWEGGGTIRLPTSTPLTQQAPKETPNSGPELRTEPMAFPHPPARCSRAFGHLAARARFPRWPSSSSQTACLCGEVGGHTGGPDRRLETSDLGHGNGPAWICTKQSGLPVGL